MSAKRIRRRVLTMNPAKLHRLSPEIWRALEPLIDAAIALPSARRDRFLDEACHGDASLRAEVAWMVAECERSDPSLDNPAVERFAYLLEDAAVDFAPPPALLAGRFRLDRELGRGGMATVYLAHDLKHARDVALKMLRPELALVVGAERFLAEIQMTATLRHPHILPLFDSGEADGCIYFVMPYVEGGTLRDRLMRERILPKSEALRIAAQVADGLASAHEQGIVHRDIKPENILLAANGRHAYVADFGIALAMSRIGADRASGTWLRVGTRTYMSPEQLIGSAEIDARTDIFSLGCVIHEMLEGAPPERSELQYLKSPRRIVDLWRATRRPLADRSLERIVRRSLADSPADRFQTASDFGRAISSLAAPRPGTSTRSKWLQSAAATGILAAILATTASSEMKTRVRTWLGYDVDPDLLVVLPFRSDNSGLALISGDNAARLLYDALGRWKDLKLVDEMAAVDAGRRTGPALASVAEARAAARSLGAGRFVWGAVSDQHGVTRLSAELYDQRHPERPITHVAYMLASDSTAAKIEETADSLVAKLVGTPAANVGTNGTRTFTALKRYADGYQALHEWNTDLAEQEFRGAVDLDPHFSQAWLGLAQSMAWSRLYRAAEWAEPANRALADSNSLSPRDRLLATGLVAVAQSRMQDACDVYRRLIARNSRDFAAHYGLGDCLSMDRLVLADRNSPTGWKFRGSLQTAIQEYLRALELVPSYMEGSRGQTFARLTNRILFDDLGDFRRGFALTPDTAWMAAYPEVSSDTLAFFPRPRAALGFSEPATHRDALARNRDLLRSLTARWVAAYPRSATAWGHYAGALESVGALDTLDESRRGPGALRAIQLARRLGGADKLAALQYLAAQVRILLKLRRFSAAEAVVDSALTTFRLPTPQEANVLAPLAALLGRPRLTARLLATVAADTSIELFTDRRGGGRGLPAPVLTAAGTFTGYAIFGTPPDSLRASRDRLERAIRNSIGSRDLEHVRAMVFLPSSLQAGLTLGIPMLSGLRDSQDRLLVAWQALGRRDSSSVRAMLRREGARMTAADYLPEPDVSLDYALLALAMGDTTSARGILDRVAVALPELSMRLTTEASAAAALPRVFLMRARLAARTDSEHVSLCKTARALWQHADAELRAASDSLDAGTTIPHKTGGRPRRPPTSPPS